MADSPVPPPNPSDDLTPEDSNPLGLQHPLSAPEPLGQQVPNLQFMRPLGAQPLGILDPSIFFRGELTSPYSALTEPYNSSPFFQASQARPTNPSDRKSPDSPPATSEPASVQRQVSTTSELPPLESSAPALEALDQSFAADGTLQRARQTPTTTPSQLPAPSSPSKTPAPSQASTSAPEPSPVSEVVDSPSNPSPDLIQRSPETSSSSTPSSTAKRAVNYPIQNLNPPSALTDYPALGSSFRIRPSQDSSITDSALQGSNLSSESTLQPSPLSQASEPILRPPASDQAATPATDVPIAGIEPSAAALPSNIQRQAIDHPEPLPETSATDPSRPNLSNDLPTAIDPPTSARPFHPGSVWSAAVERVEGAPPSPAASPSPSIQRQADLPSDGASSSASPDSVETANTGTSSTTSNPQPAVFSTSADLSDSAAFPSSSIQRQADLPSVEASDSSPSIGSGNAPNTIASAITEESAVARQQPADISNTIGSPNTLLQRQADGWDSTASAVPTQQPSAAPISSSDPNSQAIQQQPDSTLLPVPELSGSTPNDLIPNNLIQRQADDIAPADTSTPADTTNQYPQGQIETFAAADDTSTPIQRQVESVAFEAPASSPRQISAEPSTPSDNLSVASTQQQVEGSAFPDFKDVVDTPNIPIQRQADTTAVTDSASTTLPPRTGDSASADFAKTPLPQQAGNSVASSSVANSSVASSSATQNPTVTPSIQRQPDVPDPSGEPGLNLAQSTEEPTPSPSISVTDGSVTPIQRQAEDSDAVGSTASPSVPSQQQVDGSSSAAAATTPLQTQGSEANSTAEDLTPIPIQRQEDPSQLSGSASVLTDPQPVGNSTPIPSGGTPSQPAAIQRQDEFSSIGDSINPPLPERARETGLGDATIPPLQQPVDGASPADSASQPTIQRQVETVTTPLPLEDFSASSVHPPVDVSTPTDFPSTEVSPNPLSQGQADVASAEDSVSLPIQRQADASVPSEAFGGSTQRQVDGDSRRGELGFDVPIQRQGEGSGSETVTSASIQPQIEGLGSEALTSPPIQRQGEDLGSEAATSPSIQPQNEDLGSEAAVGFSSEAPISPPIQRQGEDLGSEITASPSIQRQGEDLGSEAPISSPIQRQGEDLGSEAVTSPPIQRQGEDLGSEITASPSIQRQIEDLGSEAAASFSSEALTGPPIQRQSEDSSSETATNIPIQSPISDSSSAAVPNMPLQQSVNPAAAIDLSSPHDQSLVEPSSPSGDLGFTSVQRQAEVSPSVDLTSADDSLQRSADASDSANLASTPSPKPVDVAASMEAISTQNLSEVTSELSAMPVQRQVDDLPISENSSFSLVQRQVDIDPTLDSASLDATNIAVPGSVNSTPALQQQASDVGSADVSGISQRQGNDFSSGASVPPSIQRQADGLTPQSADFTGSWMSPQDEGDAQALASIAFEQQTPSAQPSEVAGVVPSQPPTGESFSPDSVTSPEATITPIQRQVEESGFGESATPPTSPQVNPFPPQAGDTVPSQIQQQVDAFEVGSSASPSLQQRADNSLSDNSLLSEADGITPIQRQTDVSPDVALPTDFAAGSAVTISPIQQQAENASFGELAAPSLQRQADRSTSTEVSDLAPDQQPDGSLPNGSPSFPAVSDTVSLDAPSTLIQHPGQDSGTEAAVAASGTPSVQRQVSDSQGNDAHQSVIQPQTDGFDDESSVPPSLQRSVEPITLGNSGVTSAQGSVDMATPADSSRAESTQPFMQRQTDVPAVEDSILPSIQQSGDGSSPSDLGSPMIQRQADPLQTRTAGSGEVGAFIASDFPDQADSAVLPDITTRQDVIQRQGEEEASSTASELRDPNTTSFSGAFDPLGSETPTGSTSQADAATPLASPSILQRQPDSALTAAESPGMMASNSSFQSASTEFLPSDLASVEQAIPSSEVVFPTALREGEPVVNDLRSQLTAPSSTTLSPTADIEPSTAVPSIQAFRDPNPALADTVQPQTDAAIDESPDSAPASSDLEEDAATTLPSVLQDLSIIRPLSTSSPSRSSPQGSSPQARDTVMRSPQGSLSELQASPGYSPLPMKPPAPTALDRVLNTINTVTSAAKPTISSNGGSSNTVVQASSAQPSATTSPPARAAHPGTEWSSIEELLRVTSSVSSSASSKSTSVSRSPEAKGFSNLQPFAAEHTLLQAKFDKAQRQLLAWQGSPPTIQRNPGDPPVPTSVAPTSQSQPGGADQGNGASLAALDKLVQEVSSLLRQRLALEHERRGSRRM